MNNYEVFEFKLLIKIFILKKKVKSLKNIQKRVPYSILPFPLSFKKTLFFIFQIICVKF